MSLSTCFFVTPPCKHSPSYLLHAPKRLHHSAPIYLSLNPNPNPNPKLNPKTLSLTSSFNLQYPPFHSIIKPYVLSQYKPILLGWLFSAVSAFSLSKLVPRIGRLSSSLTNTTMDVTTLRKEGLVLGVLFGVRGLSSYLQQSLLWDAALNAVYRIRADVFEKALGRDLGFFEGGKGVNSGDIAYRITAEAADVGDAVYTLLNTIVPSTLQFFAMAMQMLAISPALSLTSAVVIPVMALVIACLGERLRRISKRAHLSVAALSAYLNEVFPAVLFVKANNAELCEIARFQKLARVDLYERLNKRKMKALIPQITQAIYIGALFIFCIGSLVISGGSFDGGGMVSFITSLVLLIEPIQGVGKAYNEFKQGEPAIERLFDLSRSEPKVVEKPDAMELDDVAGELKFCDVSFKYGDNLPLVLDGMNFHVKAGETVAIVGPSGGGKTTLAKLLLRLYDPSSGCISIDNHNIENIRLENLRRHVCLVSQDIILFSGSVAENIGYRDLITKIDMDRVKLAGQLANADEFIKMLPGGYKANIGPRGSVLSGGQKQRLAIARAIYQNPSILVLDEATSALDSKSELLVRQALHRLMENRTVMVIAHRLETIRMAKQVFILKEGKLQKLLSSSLFSDHEEGIASAGLAI